jgi:hypothetical protein
VLCVKGIGTWRCLCGGVVWVRRFEREVGEDGCEMGGIGDDNVGQMTNRGRDGNSGKGAWLWK